MKNLLLVAALVALSSVTAAPVRVTLKAAEASTVPVPTPTSAVEALCLSAGSSCSQCNDYGTPCAWCQTTQTCVPAAGKFGPVSCTKLVTASQSCPGEGAGSPCQQGQATTNCHHCVRQSWNCGWCEGTQACMEGNSTGPNKGRVCKQGWSYGNKATSCPLCSHRYGNCATCTAAPGCGWCPNAQAGYGACLSGNATTAFPASQWQGQCGGWTPAGTQCPAAYTTFAPGGNPTCNAATSCDQCTAINGCGWCNSTQQCYQGDSSGASNPNICDIGWQWQTCQLNCSAYTTCDACNGDGTGECGWCSITQKCSRGTVTGPFDTKEADCPGPYWQFGPYGCLDCSSNNGGGCSSCTNTEGCGWCHASQVCYEGSPSGPLTKHATCPLGNWTFESYECP